MITSRRETKSQFPYPGLRPFEPQESDIFFGRDAHIDELLFRLSQRRFLAVIGPSGCGKSSLIAAGMLPALAGGFMVGTSAQWVIAKMRPGEHPLSRLADVLLRDTPLGETLDPNSDDFSEECAMMEALLRRGPLGLVEALRGSPIDQRGKPETERKKLLILVDQFEEIFRYRTEEHKKATDDEKDAFVALLLESIFQQEFSIFVVITMRSDFIGDCATFPGLPEIINDGLYLTPRLTREECREAIIGPAELFGTKIEPALVNRLLNDSGSDPDQLPLLQHVLMRLWRKHSGGAITSEEFKEKQPPIGIDLYESPAIGGFAEALSRHLDHVYNEYLDDTQKRLAEILFKALCERRGNQTEIRRPTALGTIAEIGQVSVEEVAAVVEIFRRPGRSFISPRRGELNQDTMLDISHESLIRNWKRLREWAKQETESAHQYRRLEETAVLWKRGGADLWRGVDLAIALQWKKREKPNKSWALQYGSQFSMAMEFLRRSQIWRNLRLFIRTSIGSFVVGLFIAGIIWHFSTLDSALSQRSRIELNGLSLHLLGLFDNLPDRKETGRKAAVDVAWQYFRTGNAVGEGALLGIRLGLDYYQNGFWNLADAQKRIPLLKIPGKPNYFFTIREKNKVVLWKKEKQTKISRLWNSGAPRKVEEFSVEHPIQKIAVSADGARFGVQCTNDEILVWNLTDYAEEEPEPRTLEIALGLSDAEREKFVKTTPSVRDLIIEAASEITFSYRPEDELPALQLPTETEELKKLLTNQIVEARKNVIDGSIEEALTPIKEIGFEEDEAKQILCMTFVNEGHRSLEAGDFSYAKTCYEIAKRLGEALSEKQIDSFIALAEWKQARVRGNIEEAKSKYAKAIELNPDIEPFVAILFIDEGNNLANKGDKESAIRAYEEALKLDPTLRPDLDPESEYRIRAPQGQQTPAQGTE